jgi:hypothetical protein
MNTLVGCLGGRQIGSRLKKLKKMNVPSLADASQYGTWHSPYLTCELEPI